MRKLLMPAATLGVVLNLACASAGGRSRSSCEFASRDSVFLDGTPVYLACAVSRPAQVVREYLPRGVQPRAGQTCLSAAFAFVVDSAGAPEGPTIRIERTNDPAFAQAVASVIPSWQYRPAELNGRPVRQVVRTEKRVVLTIVVAGQPGQRPAASSFNC
jgi:hypothetical protein